MAKITINGKFLEVNDGLTVLEAALQAGIYIPHLCYHPDLKPTGACRLCIVEIEGIRGYPPSCATNVRDGMSINTNTPEIVKMRKNLIWLLLSGYPEMPPDHTLLKKVVDYIGINEILDGFEKKPKNLPIRTEEPLFIMNPNLCILCERCVRICHDIRGAGILGYVNRGIETFVTTAYNLSLKDVDCRVCRACVEVCPSGALSDKEQFTEDERDLKLLPCKNTCPAGIDIPRYLRLTSEKRYQDAIEVIREKVPLPHVLGLVCTHPCEKVCLRNEVSEPIAINAIKRFVAERDNKRWKKKLRIAPNTGKRVAIVGSGASGLTAAWFLRILGHSVTIFERLPKLGGSMRLIPDYRLPKSILEKEIDEILSIGIDVKNNTNIDSIDNLFSEGFHAVFVGIGTVKGMKMGISGEDDNRVQDGLSILTSISAGKEFNFGGQDILIVGGGNVAIDVSRSLLRLGAKSVCILYRRTRDEMPANYEEVTEALHEGVKIEFLTTPVKIIPDENKLKVECIKMQLEDADSKGRRKPVPVEGSEFIVDADRLIMAIGQKLKPMDALRISKEKHIFVSQNMETERDGVFAGGDAVSGPSNVISAIQAGRMAAKAIDKYLGGSGNIELEFIPQEKDDPWMGREEGFGYAKRAKMPTIAFAKRLEAFDLVELGVDEEKAIQEAKRCLRCQLRLTITRQKIVIQE